MQYEKTDFIKKLKTILDNGTNCLYDSREVNYSGNIKNTDIPYTEEIIDYLYKNNYIKNCEISGINSITRKNSYCVEDHFKLLNLINKNSNREEEYFVKSLFFFNPFKSKLGTAIDYQVPLRGCIEDKSKAIDLITYKKDTNEIFIVEVKKEGSKETALRCCLEVQTYYQILDKEKFIKDYQEKNIIESENPKIRKAIIIFQNSTPAKEISNQSRANLQKIIKDFDIEICSILYS